MNLPFNKIILHCSATKDSGTVSWDAIRKYHIEVMHFRDNGYHFGLENVNGKLAYMVGRPLTEWGAHCEGHNTGSLGICVIGDYDKDILDPAREIAVVKLCTYLCSILGINPKQIYGHREFNPAKTCPGMKFPLLRVKDGVAKLYGEFEARWDLLLHDLSGGTR